MFTRIFSCLFLLLTLSPVRAEPALLEPDKAFRFSARMVDARQVEVSYQIAPGYYLYRDKFRFSAEPADVHLGEAVLPPGQLRTDEFFGEVQTYRGALTFRVPLQHDGSSGTMLLKVTSQGCADVGVCYVPHEQQARLSLASVTTVSGGPEDAAASRLFGSGPSFQPDDSLIAELFGGGVLLLLASFFVFGLLLSFTPCVLPMLPILSSVIVGQGQRVGRQRAVLLSVAYVLGMALTYTAAGVAAGFSGSLLSAALQSPWLIGSFALVFVLLAGAMFGFYELQLPAAAQTRMVALANRLPGGHFAGVFVMGALSALILGPCMAAPLAGALLYISQSGDGVLGGAALFAMSLGMGVPLIIVGASAGALLPKAGPWMEAVKRFFGVILLGVAIYLISPFIPVSVQMLGWAVLLMMSGVHLRALDALPAGASGYHRFGKGVGVIVLVTGVAFLIGALSGGRDVLQPLSSLRVGAGTGVPDGGAVAFQRVSSLTELDAAVVAAAGKPVMLDFYADWCVSCKELERYTFTDSRVRERLGRMVKLQVDVTGGTPDHSALLQRFKLFGPPGIVFFDRRGGEISGLRVIGFQPPERFVTVLDRALAFD